MVSGTKLTLHHHCHHHTSTTITSLDIAPLTVFTSTPTATVTAIHSSNTILSGVSLGAELEGAACPLAGGVLSRWLFSSFELLNSGNEKHIRAS